MNELWWERSFDTEINAQTPMEAIELGQYFLEGVQGFLDSDSWTPEYFIVNVYCCTMTDNWVLEVILILIAPYPSWFLAGFTPFEVISINRNTGNVVLHGRWRGGTGGGIGTRDLSVGFFPVDFPEYFAELLPDVFWGMQKTMGITPTPFEDSLWTLERDVRYIFWGYSFEDYAEAWDDIVHYYSLGNQR
jgi:hypothetical protein